MPLLDANQRINSALADAGRVFEVNLDTGEINVTTPEPEP